MKLKIDVTAQHFRQRIFRKYLAISLILCTSWMAGAVTPVFAQPPALLTISTLNLERYSGKWYEISRLPMWFERRCLGDVSASYTLRLDQTVGVLNACRTAEGVISAQGIAVVPNPQHPGQLRVRFAPAWLSFLPFVWGDYWVIDLAPDYSWALVGSPSREYLWILARTPTLDASITISLKDKGRAFGFLTERMIDVENTGN
jgi:apolipoprotein D and lipocalin family protein